MQEAVGDQAAKPQDDRIRLPVGTLLNGHIKIEGEIGAGGFGITYRGRDLKLGRLLAVKEYFPVDIGNRDSTMSVHPLTSNQGKIFHWGLDKFIQEAKTLATFDHPGIVHVNDYFEENQTGYMALQFVEGQSFSRWLSDLGRPPTQAELDHITTKLCESLTEVHSKGFIHRDIAPDNIIIKSDGTPVLLDFGAARQDLAVHSRIQRHQDHSTSYPIVKHFYSPFEARSTDKNMRGPFSDVYSLGATLYRAVTGAPPADAFDRIGADVDPVVSAVRAAKPGYRLSFLEAIDAALAVKYKDRLQGISAFRSKAFEQPKVRPAPQPTPPPVDIKVSTPSEFGRWQPQGPTGAPPTPPSRLNPALVVALALFAVVIVGGGAWLASKPDTQRNAPDPGAGVGRLSEFASQRQLVDTAVERLRGALTEARKANSERQWSRQSVMAVEAEKFAGEARAAADRLAAVARSDLERRQAQDYLGAIQPLTREASDMRTSADAAIAKDDRDRAVQRDRDATAQRDRDAAAQRDRDRQALFDQQRQAEERLRRLRELEDQQRAAQRTWQQFSGRWVEGEGYNRPVPTVNSPAECAQLCVGDSRCRMWEYSLEDRTRRRICNLFTHKAMARTSGNATVGVMND